jgi:ribose 1,5-bisphosphokinase
MAGAFVAIVGPSGAGKDTLIAHARTALAADAGFVFVRRLVTRGTNAFEDHDTIDPASFEAGHAAGSFALSWHAHGLGYALPAETLAAVQAGSVAVCNLSRSVLAEARRRFPRVAVVLVTAPPEVLAVRLTARGRESAEAVAERLRREAACDEVPSPDLVVMNDRPIATTGGELVAFLSRLKETQPA